MTRSRASAKAAGTRTETAVARYLAEHVDERVERRRLSGSRDRGDIAGLRTNGRRVVVEVKDCAKLELGAWLTEVEVERGNDDAIAGLVVAKRRGKGDPGDLLVAMTLADLVALLTGERPVTVPQAHGEPRTSLLAGTRVGQDAHRASEGREGVAE